MLKGGRSLPTLYIGQKPNVCIKYIYMKKRLLSPTLNTKQRSPSCGCPALTLSLTNSLQSGLVTESVLTRLGNKLETRVDGLGVLLGLDSRGHFISACLFNVESRRLVDNVYLQVVDTKEEDYNNIQDFS